MQFGSMRSVNLVLNLVDMNRLVLSLATAVILHRVASMSSRGHSVAHIYKCRRWHRGQVHHCVAGVRSGSVAAPADLPYSHPRSLAPLRSVESLGCKFRAEDPQLLAAAWPIFSAPRRIRRLEPEIHRVDAESGSTLIRTLIGIFSQTAGTTCEF
jgi:hypothetical protein